VQRQPEPSPCCNRHPTCVADFSPGRFQPQPPFAHSRVPPTISKAANRPPAPRSAAAGLGHHTVIAGSCRNLHRVRLHHQNCGGSALVLWILPANGGLHRFHDFLHPLRGEPALRFFRRPQTPRLTQRPGSSAVENGARQRADGSCHICFLPSACPSLAWSRHRCRAPCDTRHPPAPGPGSTGLSALPGGSQYMKARRN